ncbi:MAG: hypothetical protein RLZZ543_1901 [Bacteroidota bacterium]|jgi:hypothetical protein
MRSIRLFLLLLIISVSVNAQGIATDTVIDFFNSNGATLIASPNGGYMSGTNGYGDSEKLQAFFPLRSYSLLGAFVWTGKKTWNSGDLNSRICLKVKAFDTTSTSTYPYFKGISNTLDSVYVSLSDIDTGSSFANNLQYIAFDTPVLVNSFYAVGINFDSLSRDSSGHLIDSIAIYSTAMDSASIEDMSWEKWNGDYKRISDTWGFNADFAIFPVIDTTLTAIEKTQLERILIYPNPTADKLNIKLPNGFDSFMLSVYAINGQLVLEKAISSENAILTMDVSELMNGFYTLRLKNERWTGVSPIIIQH